MVTGRINGGLRLLLEGFTEGLGGRGMRGYWRTEIVTGGVTGRLSWLLEG